MTPRRSAPEDFEPEPPLYAKPFRFLSSEELDSLTGVFRDAIDPPHKDGETYVVGPPPEGARSPWDPPHNSTPTSIQAAASKRSTAATERARVLAYIQSRRDGATREEIEEALGMSGNTVRPRVWEMLGANGHSKVIREGPTTRKTKAGRNAAILWGTL